MKVFRQNARAGLTLFMVCFAVSFTFTGIAYFGGFGGENITLATLAALNFARFFLWGAFFPVIFLLTSKYGFDRRNEYLRSFFVHVLIGILLSSIQYFLYAVVYWSVDPTLHDRYPAFMPYLRTSYTGNLYIGLILYALTVFAAQAYLSHQNFAAEEKRAAALESDLIRSQLQALKMQLQPHFLFNTLNSISSLILTDTARAHGMIAQLGDFLRLTLDYNEDEMVSLREELRFLRSYLDIEQIRFSDRLQVDFNLQENTLDSLVPHLILQPIVENSIKHGISLSREGGSIEINSTGRDNKVYIQVIDDGPGVETKGDYTGTGLPNVQSRLEHIYGESFDFTMRRDAANKMVVTIVLPLRQEAHFEKI